MLSVEDIGSGVGSKVGMLDVWLILHDVWQSLASRGTVGLAVLWTWECTMDNVLWTIKLLWVVMRGDGVAKRSNVAGGCGYFYFLCGGRGGVDARR